MRRTTATTVAIFFSILISTLLPVPVAFAATQDSTAKTTQQSTGTDARSSVNTTAEGGVGKQSTEAISGRSAPSYQSAITSFGFPAVLPFRGVVSEHVISIPVPDGLVPSHFYGNIKVAPTITSGVFSIEHRERALATFTLPFQRTNLTSDSHPIVVPLDDIPIVDGVMTITLRALLNPDTGLCSTYHLLWAELSAAKVDFSGAAVPPKQLNNFWSQNLSEVEILLADKPSHEEIEAALDISAFAARTSLRRKVAVVVDKASNLERLEKTDTTELTRRTVVLEVSDESKLQLQYPPHSAWPYLKISAPRETIAAVTRNALGVAKHLLISQSAQVVPGTREHFSERHSKITLEQLGYRDMLLQGQGSTEQQITFSQADLGGSLGKIQFRVAGNHSPVTEDANAYVAILFNGGLVMSKHLSAVGAFDFYVPLPPFLLQRDNTLTVRLHYTPNDKICRLGTDEIIFSIHKNSYLEIGAGQTLPTGFTRFPQSLFPTFQVALDDISLSSVQAAANTVSALQLLTKTPLRPKVQPWAKALSSPQTLIAIASDAKNSNGLAPLLEIAPFKVLDSQNHELFRVDPDAPFSLLQGFEHGNRDVLLLSHYKYPNGLSALSDIVKEKRGWYELAGDVLLLPADSSAVQNFRLRKSGLHYEPLPEGPATRWSRYRTHIFIATLALVVLFLFWSYPRIVRKKPL